MEEDLYGDIEENNGAEAQEIPDSSVDLYGDLDDEDREAGDQREDPKRAENPSEYFHDVIYDVQKVVTSRSESPVDDLYDVIYGVRKDDIVSSTPVAGRSCGGKIQENLDVTLRKLKALEDSCKVLEARNQELLTENSALKANIVSLIDTCRKEITRKNEHIRSKTRELEDILFKRAARSLNSRELESILTRNRPPCQYSCLGRLTLIQSRADAARIQKRDHVAATPKDGSKTFCKDGPETEAGAASLENRRRSSRKRSVSPISGMNSRRRPDSLEKSAAAIQAEAATQPELVAVESSLVLDAGRYLPPKARQGKDQRTVSRSAISSDQPVSTISCTEAQTGTRKSSNGKDDAGRTPVMKDDLRQRLETRSMEQQQLKTNLQQGIQKSQQMQQEAQKVLPHEDQVQKSRLQQQAFQKSPEQPRQQQKSQWSSPSVIVPVFDLRSKLKRGNAGTPPSTSLAATAKSFQPSLSPYKLSPMQEVVKNTVRGSPRLAADTVRKAEVPGDTDHEEGEISDEEDVGNKSLEHTEEQRKDDNVHPGRQVLLTNEGAKPCEVRVTMERPSLSGTFRTDAASDAMPAVIGTVKDSAAIQQGREVSEDAAAEEGPKNRGMEVVERHGEEEEGELAEIREYLATIKPQINAGRSLTIRDREEDSAEKNIREKCPAMAFVSENIPLTDYKKRKEVECKEKPKVKSQSLDEIENKNEKKRERKQRDERRSTTRSGMDEKTEKRTLHHNDVTVSESSTDGDKNTETTRKNLNDTELFGKNTAEKERSDQGGRGQSESTGRNASKQLETEKEPKETLKAHNRSQHWWKILEEEDEKQTEVVCELREDDQSQDHAGIEKETKEETEVKSKNHKERKNRSETRAERENKSEMGKLVKDISKAGTKKQERDREVKRNRSRTEHGGRKSICEKVIEQEKSKRRVSSVGPNKELEPEKDSNHANSHREGHQSILLKTGSGIKDKDHLKRHSKEIDEKSRKDSRTPSRTGDGQEEKNSKKHKSQSFEQRGAKAEAYEAQPQGSKRKDKFFEETDSQKTKDTLRLIEDGTKGRDHHHRTRKEKSQREEIEASVLKSRKQPTSQLRENEKKEEVKENLGSEGMDMNTVVITITPLLERQQLSPVGDGKAAAADGTADNHVYAEGQLFSPACRDQRGRSLESQSELDESSGSNDLQPPSAKREANEWSCRACQLNFKSRRLLRNHRKEANCSYDAMQTRGRPKRPKTPLPAAAGDSELSTSGSSYHQQQQSTDCQRATPQLAVSKQATPKSSSSRLFTPQSATVSNPADPQLPVSKRETPQPAASKTAILQSDGIKPAALQSNASKPAPPQSAASKKAVALQSAASKSAALQSTASKPVTPKSATPKPATPQSTSSKQAAPQVAVSRPATPQSTVSNPAALHLNAPKAAIPRLAASKLATLQPSTSKPIGLQLPVSKPATSQLAAFRPTVGTDSEQSTDLNIETSVPESAPEEALSQSSATKADSAQLVGWKLSTRQSVGSESARTQSSSSKSDPVVRMSGTGTGIFESNTSQSSPSQLAASILATPPTDASQVAASQLESSRSCVLRLVPVASHTQVFHPSAEAQPTAAGSASSKAVALEPASSHPAYPLKDVSQPAACQSATSIAAASKAASQTCANGESAVLLASSPPTTAKQATDLTAAQRSSEQVVSIASAQSDTYKAAASQPSATRTSASKPASLPAAAKRYTDLTAGPQSARQEVPVFLSSDQSATSEAAASQLSSTSWATAIQPDSLEPATATQPTALTTAPQSAKQEASLDGGQLDVGSRNLISDEELRSAIRSITPGDEEDDMLVLCLDDDEANMFSLDGGRREDESNKTKVLYMSQALELSPSKHATVSGETNSQPTSIEKSNAEISSIKMTSPVIPPVLDSSYHIPKLVKKSRPAKGTRQDSRCRHEDKSVGGERGRGSSQRKSARITGKRRSGSKTRRKSGRRESRDRLIPETSRSRKVDRSRSRSRRRPQQRSQSPPKRSSRRDLSRSRRKRSPNTRDRRSPVAKLRLVARSQSLSPTRLASSRRIPALGPGSEESLSMETLKELRDRMLKELSKEQTEEEEEEEGEIVSDDEDQSESRPVRSPLVTSIKAFHKQPLESRAKSADRRKDSAKPLKVGDSKEEKLSEVRMKTEKSAKAVNSRRTRSESSSASRPETGTGRDGQKSTRSRTELSSDRSNCRKNKMSDSCNSETAFAKDKKGVALAKNAFSNSAGSLGKGFSSPTSPLLPGTANKDEANSGSDKENNKTKRKRSGCESLTRTRECDVRISLSCLAGYTAEELDTKLIPFKQRQFRELQAEARQIQAKLERAERRSSSRSKSTTPPQVSVTSDVKKLAPLKLSLRNVEIQAPSSSSSESFPLAPPDSSRQVRSGELHRLSPENLEQDDNAVFHDISPTKKIMQDLVLTDDSDPDSPTKIVKRKSRHPAKTLRTHLPSPISPFEDSVGSPLRRQPPPPRCHGVLPPEPPGSSGGTVNCPTNLKALLATSPLRPEAPATPPREEPIKPVIDLSSVEGISCILKSPLLAYQPVLNSPVPRAGNKSIRRSSPLAGSPVDSKSRRQYNMDKKIPGGSRSPRKISLQKSPRSLSDLVSSPGGMTRSTTTALRSNDKERLSLGQKYSTFASAMIVTTPSPNRRSATSNHSSKKLLSSPRDGRCSSKKEKPNLERQESLKSEGKLPVVSTLHLSPVFKFMTETQMADKPSDDLADWSLERFDTAPTTNKAVPDVNATAVAAQPLPDAATVPPAPSAPAVDVSRLCSTAVDRPECAQERAVLPDTTFYDSGVGSPKKKRRRQLGMSSEAHVTIQVYSEVNLSGIPAQLADFKSTANNQEITRTEVVERHKENISLTSEPDGGSSAAIFPPTGELPALPPGQQDKEDTTVGSAVGDCNPGNSSAPRRKRKLCSISSETDVVFSCLESSSAEESNILTDEARKTESESCSRAVDFTSPEATKSQPKKKRAKLSMSAEVHVMSVMSSH